MSKVITNRFDGTILVAVHMSDPNNDPDLKVPRQDPETQHGYFSPPCAKRHVRTLSTERGHSVWVLPQVELGKLTENVAKDAGIALVKRKDSFSLSEADSSKLALAMGAKYFDIRAFGGVLANCNTRVTGPVQIGFGVSLDPVSILDVPITVCAVPKEKDGVRKSMGRMPVVRFGLYRADFSVCPSQAVRTGFTEEDLLLVLEGFLKGFENNPSTVRSNVYVERMDLFKHDSASGNASKRQLVKAVKTERVDLSAPPSKVEDYALSVDLEGLEGVTHYAIQSVADLAKIGLS